MKQSTLRSTLSKIPLIPTKKKQQRRRHSESQNSWKRIEWKDYQGKNSFLNWKGGKNSNRSIHHERRPYIILSKNVWRDSAREIRRNLPVFPVGRKKNRNFFKESGKFPLEKILLKTSRRAMRILSGKGTIRRLLILSRSEVDFDLEKSLCQEIRFLH